MGGRRLSPAAGRRHNYKRKYKSTRLQQRALRSCVLRWMRVGRCGCWRRHSLAETLGRGHGRAWPERTLGAKQQGFDMTKRASGEGATRRANLGIDHGTHRCPRALLEDSQHHYLPSSDVP